jgi:type IV secretory pathway VirD2 relaxase
MPVMVKALGYHSHKGGKAAGGLRKIKAHLKYLEHGKIHEEKPKGFDGARDDVSRAEFMERLEAQPARGVIAHKVVFSLSQDERDRLGVSLRELVRETMRAWEEMLGRALTWVGFQHEDKGHPHVHVVVAGYAGGKQVGLYERDLNCLRGFADREKERQAELNRVLPTRGAQERSVRDEAARLMELTRPVREREDFRGR